LRKMRPFERSLAVLAVVVGAAVAVGAVAVGAVAIRAGCCRWCGCYKSCCWWRHRWSWLALLELAGNAMSELLSLVRLIGPLAVAVGDFGAFGDGSAFGRCKRLWAMFGAFGDVRAFAVPLFHSHHCYQSPYMRRLV
jgi:hypothetical protein